IWRYPVQSMRGEALTDTEIGADGVVGDRAYGIVDPESGTVVSSAQGRRKWRDIVTFAARYRGGPTANGAAAPIDILLPDGTVLAGGQPDIDARPTAPLGPPGLVSDQGARDCRSPSDHAPQYAVHAHGRCP